MAAAGPWLSLSYAAIVRSRPGAEKTVAASCFRSWGSCGPAVRPPAGPRVPETEVPWSAVRRSKVRRVGDRHRIFLPLEELLVTEIVLRAGPLSDWALDLLPARHARPRLLECAR